MLFMTALRLHQSSRSSSSLLANTVGQQVSLLLLNYRQHNKAENVQTSHAASKNYTLCDG